MKNRFLEEKNISTMCNPIFSYLRLKCRLHKALVTFKVAVIRGIK